MDEVLFRGTEKLEAMQMQADLVASKTKDLVKSYSQSTRVLLSEAWQSPTTQHAKQHLLEVLMYLIEASKEIKDRTIRMIDPRNVWGYLSSVLNGALSRREVTIACAGFIIGSLVGAAVGLSLKRKNAIVRYMEAVQISHYLGPESATVVEDAIAPYECGDYDVLINVKAASVQIVDAQICSGYGKTYRKILRKLHNQSSSDLPVVLGRDCTGIITDLGRNVRRLEIGDEVWLSVPFWSQGTLCQTILISESRVARKPKNVGFEGACSIPYAGSLALSLLTEARIDLENVKNKRFLVQDGCTPVGCVLIQLLANSNAHITTTCYKRAVPVAKAMGATDVISLEDSQDENVTTTSDKLASSKAILKELEAKGEQFDVVILTRRDCLDSDVWNIFCVKGGKILSTIPSNLESDSYGFLNRLILTGYIRLKFLIQRILDLPVDGYDEAHLCHATLDRLTELVEDGVLQTVVDKVYQPKDIELALHHIQSSQSIGSSVITFR